MDLAQLEAFLEAAHRGSFRRAAQALFLSQPSLSERIKRLEQELGQPLFHRMGRGVRLTEAGEALLPFAERALAALDQGKESLEALGDAASGRLHVGSARAISTYVLPDLLMRFRQRYPSIEVGIRTGRSSEVLQMVVNQEVHLGVARALYHPRVDTYPLYEEEIVLVTHPEHPFARAGEASIYEVANQPLILYDRDSSYFVLIDRVCREAGIAPTVPMNLDSIEATKRMVENGLGVSFLPQSAIRRELDMEMLSAIRLSEGYQVRLPTAALVPRRYPLTPPVQAFLSLLQEALGTGALSSPSSEP